MISEFMANNRRTLLDGDGNPSDWVEIYNAGDRPLDLHGYHLTDDAGDLPKWTFPDIELQPGDSLIVFASGQKSDNYVDASGHLHTNFRLSADGEFLALVGPDGTTVATGFAPEYAPQRADISYGRAAEIVSTTLVSRVTPAEVLVPSQESDLASNWNVADFVDQAWSETQASIGYDRLTHQVLADVAPQGIASQSSTLGRFAAELAVDGDPGDFTHTIGSDTGAFWRLDLSRDFDIDNLVISNRASSCCRSRLRDITVRIRDAADTKDVFTSGLLNPENGGFDFLDGPGQLTVDLVQLTGGRVTGGTIIIERTPDLDLSGSGGQGNDDEPNVLSLGEVQVNAIDDSSAANVAAGKLAFQSSSYSASFSATKATDGRSSTFSHAATTDTEAVLSVDLEQMYSVFQVTLHNRVNCCGSRLRDITVEILDEDEVPVWQSDLLNPENTGYVFPDGPDAIQVDVEELDGGAAVVGRYVRARRVSDPDLSGTAGRGNGDEPNALSLSELEDRQRPMAGGPSLAFPPRKTLTLGNVWC